MLMKSQSHDGSGSRYKHLKDTARLDQNGGSPGRFGTTPVVAVSTSEIASSID